MKKIISAIAMGTALATSAPAWAVPAPADCSLITTVSAFRTAGSCAIGDKLFTFIDSDLDLSPPVTNFSILFLSAGLTYSFNGLTPLVGTGDPLADNEYITYSIQVLDPSKWIVSVGLDSNVTVATTAGDTTVTKDIRDIGGNLLDTLVSVNGDPDSSIPLLHQYLLITDNIHLALNDILAGFNNSFVQDQRRVPEPGTLALLGIALVGAGVLRGRRRV